MIKEILGDINKEHM